MQTEKQPSKTKLFQKSRHANLYRYVPTGGYYGIARIGGKLKQKSLDTDKATVACLRLTDWLKGERQRVESLKSVASGTMTFQDAADVFKARLEADRGLKPRSKEYRLERLNALLRSWPALAKTDVSQISKNDCLQWAAQFGKKTSATAFNNTVGTLGMILAIGVEFGACYDNAAKAISKHRVLPKRLHLPSQDEFLKLVESIEAVRFGKSKASANLVRFLAFGGFRKSEAARVTWADCDFEKGTIRVLGDPETGNKNWEARTVPMIDEMKSLLLRLRSERADESPATPIMQAHECQGAISSACKRLGIVRFTHHDLRHLFATRCIESGVDIPAVSKWLGHKDGGALAMKVYGHLRQEHSVQMAKKVHFGTPAAASNIVAMPSAGEPLKEGVNVL